jgi:FtsP/CotA-like multicopper oxidase with cupredoxin domain
MHSISRRHFLGGAAATVAALSLPGGAAARGPGGGMGPGGGGGGMGTTVIDPPVGAPLRVLTPIANETPGTGVFQVSIEARRAPVDVNGTTANLLTYNGTVPGPLIRVRRDQLLRLKFRNGLPADDQVNILGDSTRVTNIHTHGLHVNPGMNPNGTCGDDMLAMADPGDELTYEYDLSMHPPGNLNFYHPHIHGCVTDQMWGGMSAPLIVEDEVTTLAPYAERVLVLKDLSLTGAEPTPHASVMQYMHGLEGNTVLVNGQVNPRLTIAPGQVQRWRVLNASTARFYRLQLQGHSMYLVGTDGGLLDKPYGLSELLLSPGERADLLIVASLKSGSYKWLSLPYDRGMMSALQQVTLMTLTYSGARQRQSLPAVVDAGAKRVQMDIASLPRKQIALTMTMGGMGGGMGPGSGGGMGGGTVGINGITYIDHEHCYMTHSMIGTWEVWEVTNGSMMDHPFHHHTNSAQVLSITGGNAGYASLYTSIPAWKDVTIVPPGGRIELLMPVMDYPGMAMLHCHIIDHEDIGMMGVWHIMGDMPMPA